MNVKKRKSFGEKEKTIGFILFAIISILLILIYANVMNKAETNSMEGIKIESMNITNKIIPVAYTYSANPFYVHFKKHYCPKCNSIMEIKYNSTIVNSNSPEAKFYDFSIPDGKLSGDVEFRTSFFHCPNCGYEIAFDEMKKLEKDKK